MQRRDKGRTLAVGVCGDEVEDVIRAVHEHVSQYIEKPTYVLDAPRIHTCVRWGQLSSGPQPVRRAPQPRHSPDFNRPAEHLIKALKGGFRKELLRRDAPRSPRYYMDLMEYVFDNYYTWQAANKDILRLPELWKYVSTPDPAGSGGGWPPARFR